MPTPRPRPADDEHVHTATGWSTASRRAARRARAGLRRQTAQSEHRPDDRRRPGELWLPAAGEPGPMAGRNRRRLRLPPHRATSEIVAGAYPFLAEEGLGTAGILIGQDAWSGTAFCYDPWVLYQQGHLTNPNIALAGQIGRGKSALAKSLACRCIAFGRRVYVPGDPKGEWTAVANAVGGQAIQLSVGSAARLNPLDEGPRPAGLTDTAWRTHVTARRTGLLAALAETTLQRPLAPTERSALDNAITEIVTNHDTPLLPAVVDAILEPAHPIPGATLDQLRADGRDLGHALARLVRGDLAGLFDGPTTIPFEPGLPMLSLDLSAINGSDTLLGLVTTCASTWLEAALADPHAGQRLVIYDEAWRLLAQPSLLARMQAHWKLSRAWGLANLLIIHRLSDLDAIGDHGTAARSLAQGLLADTATRIIYNQPYDEAHAAGRLLGLTTVEIDQLPDLAQGEGLWRINQRAFIVRHLLTPDELAHFDTNARMLTNRPTDQNATDSPRAERRFGSPDL